MANYWAKRAAKTTLEKFGVEVIVAEYPEWKFWVLPADAWNLRYQRALARSGLQPEAAALLARQKSEDYEATIEDAELDTSIMRDAFADGCIAKWDVKDAAGLPLELSPKSARLVMSHFPEIYRALSRVAHDKSRYEPPADMLEIARGNSAPALSSPPALGGTPSQPLESVTTGDATPQA